MPRSFSEDGAIGGGATEEPGQQTGGFSQSDFGGGSTPSVDQAMQSAGYLQPPSAADQSAGAGDPQTGYATYRHTSSPSGGAPTNSGFGSMPNLSNPWNTSMTQNTDGFMRVAGFANGGAIEDDINGSPEQDHIQKALASVDAVLAYGRKLHGLGGGDDEGAINTAAAMPMIPGNQSETPGPYRPGGGGQKTAAAMPMIPGNQSETPGPYRPGGSGQKLADNDGDQSGAIDTDEEAA